MTAPALPDPDATLLALDKLARDAGSYEYGLPFMGSGTQFDELPLRSYYEEDRALDGLRNVLRAWGQQCYEAGVAAERERAAKSWEQAQGFNQNGVLTDRTTMPDPDPFF